MAKNLCKRDRLALRQLHLSSRGTYALPRECALRLAKAGLATQTGTYTRHEYGKATDTLTTCQLTDLGRTTAAALLAELNQTKE